MKPSLCAVCGHAHPEYRPHIFTRSALKATSVQAVTKTVTVNSEAAVNRPLREVNKAPDAVNGEVNAAVNAPPPKNTKRGSYPGTDERRAYMREVMRARRAVARAP